MRRDLFTSSLAARVLSNSLRRILFFSYYYSGALSKAHQRRIKDGEVPWRLIRYEHIVNPEEYPLPLSALSFVRPTTFEKHLRYFLKNTNIVRLDRLLEMIATGERIPLRTVAITIDGGWRDLYSNAFPLISRYQVPVTVFLPTASIATENPPWTEFALLCLGALRAANVRGQGIAANDSRLHAVLTQLLDPTADFAAALAIFFETLWRMKPADRITVLNAIASEVNAQGGFPDLKLSLDWDEVRTMARSPLFTFASLTHSYLSMNAVSARELAIDLNDSLETFTREEISFLPLLAYPHGIFSPALGAVAKELGFRAAVGIDARSTLSAEQGIPLLGRISMFEEASYCVELMAYRLWGLAPEALVV